MAAQTPARGHKYRVRVFIRNMQIRGDVKCFMSTRATTWRIIRHTGRQTEGWGDRHGQTDTGRQVG